MKPITNQPLPQSMRPVVDVSALTEAVKPSFQRSISNIATGFFFGIGIVNFCAAIPAVGSCWSTVHVLSNQPMFTEMAPGYYYYLGVQALKVLLHLAAAATAFVGIIAAQLFRIRQ